MKYYDGPAFYRKNDLVKSEEKSRNHSNRESVNASRSRYFHPTYIPKVIGRKVITSEPDYRRLADEVRKSPNDYLLFDEDGKDAIDLTDGLMMDFKEEISERTSGKQGDEVEKELFSDAEAEKNEENESNLSASEMKESSSPEVETFYPRKNPDEDQKNMPKENIETSPGKTDARISESVEGKEETEAFEKEDGAAEETMAAEAVNSEAVEDKTASETAAVDKDLSEEGIVNVPDEKEQSTEKIIEETGYRLPPLSLLPEPIEENDPQIDEWVLNQAETLNETLKAFKVEASVSNWTVGPTVTQFELNLGRGVKVNKITNLNDDLKLALAAKDIRIEAPIPGRSTVGIEIPNKKSRPVLLSEVLGSDEFQTADSPLTTALGVDLFGRACVTDIQKMPHGLIAGATGSGKSVFINSMLMSILYKAKPSEVKLLLIDPKAVEMAPYQGLPHLLSPVISDSQAATEALKRWRKDIRNLPPLVQEILRIITESLKKKVITPESFRIS